MKIIIVEEQYRTRIEQRYGSIIRFKKELYTTMGRIDFDLINQVVEDMWTIVKKSVDEIMIQLQPVYEWFKIASRQIIEDCSDLNKQLSKALELQLDVKEKIRAPLKFEKVSLDYSRNIIQIPAIRPRNRSNC